MAEYLDKNATVGVLEAMSRNADCECIKKRLEKVAKRVGTIPAADVAPVVHGRWRESGPLLECQSCGESYSRLGGNAGKLWNYCPNCGAKMDGGAENAVD